MEMIKKIQYYKSKTPLIRKYICFIVDVYKYYFIRIRRKGFWMSEIYSDHMVLQRNKTLKIRGHANAGAYVELSFAGNTYETGAGIDGNWCVVIPAMEAGGPYDMIVRSGRKKLHFRDILIGEVWLLAGMSCMKMKLGGAVLWPSEKESWISAEQNGKPLFPLRFWQKDFIRYFSHFPFPSILRNWYNQYELGGVSNWSVATVDSVGGCSGYGYYFAKNIYKDLQVPIGIIETEISACPYESYTDREFLMEKAPDMLTGEINRYATGWLKSYVHLMIERNLPEKSEKRSRYVYDPGFAFEARLRNLDKYSIRGFLYGGFFQHPELEKRFFTLFSMMVESWRKYWGEHLPVYCVQLGRRPQEPMLSLFRNQIRQLPDIISGCRIVVSYDTIEEDEKDFYHPCNRHDVGERLARQALCYTYGKKNIVPSGPVYHEAQLRDNLIRIKFEFSEGLRTSDGKPVREMEVAGEDGCFVAVDAMIETDVILINCPDSILFPVWIRHAWKDFTDANLVNGEGLPASTFLERIIVE